jgi:predicted RNA-binding protein YlxR (DUF448 family)
VAAKTARRPADDRSGEHLRLCALSRAERPPDELLRFVVAPDGTLTPDLARRLPGRGVWVTADRQSLEAAQKTKAFARSLKQQVTVPPDLPDLVEGLLVKRLGETLALANKAGALVTGFDKVDETVAAGKAALLVHGSDAAKDGRGKLDRKFHAVQEDRGRAPQIFDDLTIAQLSLAMGRSNVVHAALIYGGVTDKFTIEAERLRRFRSGVNTPVCTHMNATPATIE